MRTITYYLPLEGPKTTTVVLIINNVGVVAARGVAFCSHKDQFNKKLGRAIANGRAAKAWHKTHTCPNNIITRDPLLGFTIFRNKCEWLPTPTEFELSLCDKIGA